MIWLEITLVSYYNERYFIRSLKSGVLVLWICEVIDHVTTYKVVENLVPDRPHHLK